MSQETQKPTEAQDEVLYNFGGVTFTHAEWYAIPEAQREKFTTVLTSLVEAPKRLQAQLVEGALIIDDFHQMIPEAVRNQIASGKELNLMKLVPMLVGGNIVEGIKELFANNNIPQYYNTIMHQHGKAIEAARAARAEQREIERERAETAAAIGK